MKKILIISGLLLIAAAITAGAVFALSRLSTPTVLAQEPKPEQVMIFAVEEVKNGERFGGEVRIVFTDPPELPDRAVDAAGLFLSRDANTITLGTGAIEVDVSVEVINDQEPTTVVNASHSGDEIQLTVDENTVYYRDATERPEITKKLVESGYLQLTRVLEPGSLVEIGNNMEVRAWGRIKDGRLVADLIVFDLIE
jgi:hypothetical protein